MFQNIKLDDLALSFRLDSAALGSRPMVKRHLADLRGSFANAAAYEAALKAAKVNLEIFTYADTQHGFNNDTTPRYVEEAAKLAWSRTIAFFNKNLRA